MKRHARTVGAAIVGAAVTAAVLLVPRAVDEPHLQRPAYLPTAVRGLLAERMHRHRDAVGKLTKAALALDYAATAQYADTIASEPLLARPLSDDATEINNQLPAEFFTLQDELARAAKALGAAARDRRSDGVASEFGAMMKTCVACHQVYARGNAPGAR